LTRSYDVYGDSRTQLGSFTAIKMYIGAGIAYFAYVSMHDQYQAHTDSLRRTGARQ